MNISRRFLITFFTILTSTLLWTSGPAAAWEWGSGWGGKTVTGSGNIKSEVRNVTGFTGISVSVPGVVEVRQTGTEGITLETDDNLLPLIETVVERGVLKIRPIEKNTNLRTKNMKLVVNAKTVESLSVAGSGDLRAEQLKSEKLKTSVAGSGDVSIKSLDAGDLTVSIAGSGNIVIGGRANMLDGSIAGSGDLKAGKLETNAAKLSIAGSGSAFLWAKDTLKVSIAGSGDVKYYGDAKVTKSVAGSGSIVRVGAGPDQ
jgi:Putative auto-transporter adhesin, head GIN domain